MKAGLAIIFLFICINTAIARKPAIEPGGIGLSIEEIEHPKTDPANWPKFRNDEKTTNKLPAPTTTKKTERTIKTVTLKETREKITPPIYLSILIVLLPFSILAGVLLPLKSGKKEESDSDNVKYLRKDSKDDDHDPGWPKAS